MYKAMRSGHDKFGPLPWIQCRSEWIFCLFGPLRCGHCRMPVARNVVVSVTYPFDTSAGSDVDAEGIRLLAKAPVV
jgi:hypothetical protein